MTISAIQQRFLKAGFRWMEEIFNDDASGNCAIQFTISKDPQYFSIHCLGDFGWGRFSRESCWQRANQWLDDVEANKEEIPQPREH